MLGPLIEVLGYVLIPLFWLLGLLAVDYLLAFLALVFVFGVFVSVGSLILEEIELRRFPKAARPRGADARGDRREFRLPADQQPLAAARALAVPARQAGLGRR